VGEDPKDSLLCPRPVDFRHLPHWSYSIDNSVWGVGVMIILGYSVLMKKFDYPGAPLIMALVLGPMFEMALRQSLAMSNGSPIIFFTRPISASLS